MWVALDRSSKVQPLGRETKNTDCVIYIDMYHIDETFRKYLC